MAKNPARFSRVFTILIALGAQALLQSGWGQFQATSVGSSSQSDKYDTEPELISDGQDPTIKIAIVALISKGLVGYFGFGYLYFSRARIRFSGGMGGTNDGFDFPRSDLRSAQTVSTFGLGGVTRWKFQHHVYDFYRVRRSPFNGSDGKPASVHKILFQPETTLDPLPLLEAANDFEAAVIKARAHASSSRPDKTATPGPQLEKTAKLNLSVGRGGVTVYVDDVLRGRTRDDNGSFALDDLNPGTHHLRMSLTGFRDWTQTVELTVGDNTVSAVLTPAGPKPLTSSEVIELLQSGVANARVNQLVTQYGVDFALTPDLEKAMHASGANEALLAAIRRSEK